MSSATLRGPPSRRALRGRQALLSWRGGARMTEEKFTGCSRLCLCSTATMARTSTTLAGAAPTALCRPSSAGSACRASARAPTRPTLPFSVFSSTSATSRPNSRRPVSRAARGRPGSAASRSPSSWSTGSMVAGTRVPAQGQRLAPRKMVGSSAALSASFCHLTCATRFPSPFLPITHALFNKHTAWNARSHPSSNTICPRSMNSTGPVWPSPPRLSVLPDVKPPLILLLFPLSAPSI